MPQIDLSFQGWVRGANVREVTETETGNVIDVTNVSAKQVVEKLESGEWCISLGEYLYCNRKNEIEMFDFAVNEDQRVLRHAE